MALDLSPFDVQVVHSRDVVVYLAIVRFEVEQSTLWLNPIFTDKEREAILSSSLRMNFRGAWPPELTSDIHRNVQVLAYTRAAAGMSVMNSSKAHMTTAELRQSFYDRQPAMHPDLHGADREQYGSWKVSVAISEQGGHTVGYLSDSPGRLLPVSDPMRFHKELNKLVELDLMERALALTAEPL
jgi:hypothetical protein